MWEITGVHTHTCGRQVPEVVLGVCGSCLRKTDSDGEEGLWKGWGVLGVGVEEAGLQRGKAFWVGKGSWPVDGGFGGVLLSGEYGVGGREGGVALTLVLGRQGAPKWDRGLR